MVIGPLFEGVSRRIHQVNLYRLMGGKIEWNRLLGQICQRHFHAMLTNLRQLHCLRCDLEVKSEPTQPWIFVMRDHLGRKWMKDSAQPAAPPPRSGCWRAILAKDVPGH